MKITPPVSYYMSSNTGTVEIEHGIFIKCSKSKKSTITSFIKETSTQEATQPISLQAILYKYLNKDLNQRSDFIIFKKAKT